MKVFLIFRRFLSEKYSNSSSQAVKLNLDQKIYFNINSICPNGLFRLPGLVRKRLEI